ncbi:MAG: hypothetical protein ACRD8Z_25595, partial [Nitrososphaeraceae archaeon]
LPGRPPTNRIIEATSKIVEIQRLIRILCVPELADAFLKQLSIAVIDNRGNEEEILDLCLGALRNNMNPIEAYFYLFGASTKEANERPPLHGHDVRNLLEPSRSKLIRIEQLLKIRLKNDVAVFEEIERIINACNTQLQPPDLILDLHLNSLT